MILYLPSNIFHLSHLNCRVIMSSEQDKRLKPLGEDDRISALPDHILCHILSLLSTKFAARSRILSTTWKHIFESSPILDFDDSLTDVPNDHTKLKFQYFVSCVLCQHDLSALNKFRLHCTQSPYNLKMVTSWINYAIFSKFQKLDIKVLMTGSARLPPLLYNLKTLVSLKLCGKFIIEVPESAYLPQLKKMHLEEVEFHDDESARHLFSHCPVLEELAISSCEMGNIGVLVICTPSLKRLIYVGNEGFYGIVLRAAKLEAMYYNASTRVVWGISGNRYESLTKAVIFLQQEFDIFELVSRICNVRFLTLCGDSMQALFGSGQLLPVFRNLTSLELLPTYTIGWSLLPCLLASSPCLEIMSFKYGLHDRYGNFLEVAHYLPERVPTCVSTHLKEVKVGSFHGKEVEFQMLEYFLKNAKVLEKITVSLISSWSSGSGDSHILSMKDPVLTIKRILGLQGSSRACQIVFTGKFI